MCRCTRVVVVVVVVIGTRSTISSLFLSLSLLSLSLYARVCVCFISIVSVLSLRFSLRSLACLWLISALMVCTARARAPTSLWLLVSMAELRRLSLARFLRDSHLHQSLRGDDFFGRPRNRQKHGLVLHLFLTNWTLHYFTLGLFGGVFDDTFRTFLRSRIESVFNLKHAKCSRYDAWGTIKYIKRRRYLRRC